MHYKMQENHTISFRLQLRLRLLKTVYLFVSLVVACVCVCALSSLVLKVWAVLTSEWSSDWSRMNRLDSPMFPGSAACRWWNLSGHADAYRAPSAVLGLAWTTHVTPSVRSLPKIISFTEIWVDSPDKIQVKSKAIMRKQERIQSPTVWATELWFLILWLVLDRTQQKQGLVAKQDGMNH